MSTQTKIELFFGTGGVGKTTIAASRALFLASKNYRVLLITIDPAHRLRQILSMNKESVGDVERITWGNFDAILLSPEKTFKRLSEAYGLNNEFQNPIIKVLAKPHGGMNEIVALLEIHHHTETNSYDYIVVDTAPGRHFVDFINSANKIKMFFNKSFLEIFSYLGKSFTFIDKKSKSVLGLLVSSGIKKLLGYLEDVTGKQFVDTFVNAVGAVYGARDGFIGALSVHEKFFNPKTTHWYLVTSVEQQKFKEAQELFSHEGKHTIIINRCLGRLLNDWHPTINLQPLKDRLFEREEILKKLIQDKNCDQLYFPEYPHESPEDQLIKLKDEWINIK